MQQDSKENKNTLYQERLRRSKLIMDLQKKGIYWQITGTTPTTNQNTNEKQMNQK